MNDFKDYFTDLNKYNNDFFLDQGISNHLKQQEETELTDIELEQEAILSQLKAIYSSSNINKIQFLEVLEDLEMSLTEKEGK